MRAAGGGPEDYPSTVLAAPEDERAGESLARLESSPRWWPRLQWATVTIAEAERDDSWAEAPAAALDEQEALL